MEVSIETVESRNGESRMLEVGGFGGEARPRKWCGLEISKGRKRGNGGRWPER
jgi:hypothetical protein